MLPRNDCNPSEASSLNRLSYPGGARNSGSAYRRVRSAEAQGKLEPRRPLGKSTAEETSMTNDTNFPLEQQTHERFLSQFSDQQNAPSEKGDCGYWILTFVRGNFRAYFSSQQFTTGHLVFVNCKTRGWQHSPGHSIGSVILTDSLTANTQNRIVTSLKAETSTSLLVQNVGFFNVKIAITDFFENLVLLAGGDEIYVDS
ncbi:hypothetical protein EDB80DRAFT_684202 [Ilyonectria destructans]|nr:hypothetical protein EDB80DRAFT_684202 [Ilyonectria destructans]